MTNTLCLISVKEWAKHADILNLGLFRYNFIPLLHVLFKPVIPMVWERLGRRIGDTFQHVNTVLLVEANLSRSTVKLTEGNETKVSFLATGSEPLTHPSKLEMCKEMVKLARQLHQYLPVLYGMGLSCMYKDITTPDLPEYDGMMNKDRDDRQGRILLQYDRVYSALQDAIIRHGLDTPLLFQYPFGIDRRALTFYNGRKVSKPKL